MSAPKILFIGGTTADVIAKLNNPRKISLESDGDFLKYVAISFASKTELDDLQVRPGGSAANSAVAATALGAKCSLVSAVGGDLFGKHMLQNLRRHGVDLKGVRVFTRDKTSLSIVLLTGGEKSVLSYRGALAKLGPEHLDEVAVKQNEVIVTTSLSSKQNFKLFVKAVRLAHRHRKKIVFAPSMTMLHARGKEFGRLHEHFDLLICNVEEARFLTGRKGAEAAIKALPGRVRIVTCAAEGALAYAGGELLHIGAPAVEVVDTTGAGDAFTGAFVREYYSHASVREALRTATAVATLKLGHLGAHFTEKSADVDAFKRRHAKELAVKKLQ